MMNKSELKNFAINARLELLQRVTDRAKLYGVNEENSRKKTIIPTERFQKIGGALLTDNERTQRDALIIRIYENGYRQTMEEAAYTWFNRFIALRYMQEHNRLPVPMHVFPDAPGAQPQLLREAQDFDLPGVEMNQILSMLDNNQTDELYKYLLIALCNHLSEPLPGMFETISDTTELLFPDGLLKPDSVLGEMAAHTQDCWDDIQVVGWLYQYYNTQLKDETFDLLKKNVKITKDRIGAATQLFTPEWIVNYMVENSLGRLWLEGHFNASLRMKWRYYMDEAEQTPEVAAKLTEIRRDSAALQPEQITLLDPCMGSGHILVYAFDVLMDIYRSVGYTDRDAVQSIVQNNLYGLDIDDRAAQLAYFAVMMKACDYDRRFLRRGVQPHVRAIQESAKIEKWKLDALGAEKPLAKRLLETFADAKEYGSILHVPLAPEELTRLRRRMDEMRLEAQTTLTGMADNVEVLAAMESLLAQAEILAQKYDAVITNPPYMGSSGMNEKLSKFVKENYPDSKSDLFAVFMERCGEMLNERGYQGMITQHAWMFLSSYESLRNKLQNREIVNMAHLGARAFEEIGGEVVQTTAFVLQNTHTPGYKGSYARLIEPTTQDGKKEMYLAEINRHTAQQENFTKIPGHPIAYWVSERVGNCFQNNTNLYSKAPTKMGLTTGDNNRFLRMWFEIVLEKIGEKYFFYNKGGDFRKWYGNLLNIINWENDGEEVRSFKGSTIRNDGYYFKKCISWGLITTSKSSFRSNEGYSCVFGDAGPGCFPHENDFDYVISCLNSKVVEYFLTIMNPTINLSSGIVSEIPFIISETKKDTASGLARNNVNLSKTDWDSSETSWNFKKHPLI